MLRKFIDKLLFLTLLSFTVSSKASDSLKVKKIEYFEEGKLVRATFLHENEKKNREYFFDYSETFDEKLRNGVLIFNFKDEKHYSITDYFIRIDSGNVYFYNAPFVGSIQSVEKDSSERVIEANSITMTINVPLNKRICSIDSLEFIPVRKEIGFKKKYKYDSFGNLIEEKYVDRVNFGTKILFQYDSLNKQIGYLLIQKPTKIKAEVLYQKNSTDTILETFEGGKLKTKTIKKVFENNRKQELRKETYQIPLKKSKPIGEPKLTFTQENIYENNRIIKIIYTDHINNKTKIHLLKYEIYN